MPSDKMTTDVSQVLYGGHMNRIHLYGSKFSSSILTKVAPSGEVFEESFLSSCENDQNQRFSYYHSTDK